MYALLSTFVLRKYNVFVKSSITQRTFYKQISYVMVLMKFTTTSAIARALHLTNSLPMSPQLSCFNCINMHQHMLHRHQQQKCFSTAFTQRLHHRRTSISPRNTGGSLSFWYFNLHSTSYFYQRCYERYKIWAVILGMFTIGSIIKVAYFNFSRQLRI